MNTLTKVNGCLSKCAIVIAIICLFSIVVTVLGSVIWRYGLNDAPAWSEQVALLLVINVAMFGAAAGIRDEGHIGMESLVGLMPLQTQHAIAIANGLLTIVFGVVLVWGGYWMGVSVFPNKITALGISESWRYLPCLIAGVLVILFSIEHILARIKGAEVIPSWH